MTEPKCKVCGAEAARHEDHGLPWGHDFTPVIRPEPRVRQVHISEPRRSAMEVLAEPPRLVDRVHPNAPSVSKGQPSEAATAMARGLLFSGYASELETRIAAALQKLMDERDSERGHAEQKSYHCERAEKRAEAAEKERDETNARANAAGTWVAQEMAAWKARAEAAEAERDSAMYEKDRQVQGVKHFQTLLDLARQRAEAAEKELAEVHRQRTEAIQDCDEMLTDIDDMRQRAEAAEKELDLALRNVDREMTRAEAAEKGRDRWVKMAYDMEAGWDRAERYAKLWKALAKRDSKLMGECMDALVDEQERSWARYDRAKRWKTLAKRFYKDLLWRGREYQLKGRG